jgi:cell division control protein 45
VQTYRDEVPKFNAVMPEMVFEGLNDETALGYTPVSADDATISFTDECHLMLLRHWSLYDALFHSSYVATRLGIWKDLGRQKLVNLIANTGLPLVECRQSYASMKIEFKRDISPQLKKWAPRYNMPEIVFPSFLRNCGQTVVSASDSIYSLTALMDCGAEWIRKHSSATDDAQGRAGDSAGSRNLTGVGSGTRTGIAALKVDLGLFENYDGALDDARKRWTRNFYIAYDALSKYAIVLFFYCSADILSHGVHLSINFQKALVKTGNSILERHMVKSMKTFRFALLSESAGKRSTGSSEFSVFGRSIPHLERLARFISDAYKSYQKVDLPLVMAALNDDENSYLVIGLSGMSKGGNLRKKYTLSLLFDCKQIRSHIPKHC